MRVVLTPDSQPPYTPNQLVEFTVTLEHDRPAALLVTQIALNMTNTDPSVTLLSYDWVLSPPGSGVPALPTPVWFTSGPLNILPAGGSLDIGLLRVSAPGPGATSCAFVDVLSGTAVVVADGFIFEAALGTLTDGTFAFGSTAELCNGIDDDCDGLIDEDFGWPIGILETGEIVFRNSGPCLVGEGECEVQGRLQCSADGTTIECVPNVPLPSPGVEGPYLDPSCFNILDDDCDGLIDEEDPDCQGPEVCDGFDNDFDGMVDEDFALLGQPCVVGTGTCENQGIFVCAPNGAGVVCSAAPFASGTEGPPNGPKCFDGKDNDCDGLIDLDDPDCQGPEICDGFDNDGDGAVDEGFEDLGQPCSVGVGPCLRTGVWVCSPDRMSLICTASPGPAFPEGSRCDCANGIDDDCDGLIDAADPDCGPELRVAAALPLICSGPGDPCVTRHTADWEVFNIRPLIDLTAQIVALDANGDSLGALPVSLGDEIRITSSDVPADFSLQEVMVDVTAAYMNIGTDSCLFGPDMALPAACLTYDTNCDSDFDLADLATWQSRLGDSYRFIEVTSANPTLQVTARDGFTEANGFASPIPQIHVKKPQETVVVVHERDEVFVEVQLNGVAPETIAVKIDGVQILPAIGVDSATDFPGGPFGGFVQINNCLAEVCALTVDVTEDFGVRSANTLTFSIKNLCCGGHIFVVTGEPLAEYHPAQTGNTCFSDDLRAVGTSHGFEIDIITFPPPGLQAGVSILGVQGTVCHGRELPASLPPFITAARVLLNGRSFQTDLPNITLGDGDNSADTYVYPFLGTIDASDIPAERVSGEAELGTIDRGPGFVYATATDDEQNIAIDFTREQVGPIHPIFFNGGASADNATAPAMQLGGAMPIQDGVVVGITEAGIEDIGETILRRELVPRLVIEIQALLTELDGRTFDLPTNFCDPGVTLDTDPESFTLDPDAFTFDATLSNDDIEFEVFSSPAQISVRGTGKCRVTTTIFFGLIEVCVFRISVDATVSAELTTVGVRLTLDEPTIQNGGGAVPEVLFNNADLTFNIEVNDLDLGCILGNIAQLIIDLADLFGINVIDELEMVAEDFIADRLDVEDLIADLDIPPLPIPQLQPDPLPIQEANLIAEFDLEGADVTPLGLTLSYGSRFEPTQINPNVGPWTGSVASLEPPPAPPFPGNRELQAVLSDDALNQLLLALTISGAFEPGFAESSGPLSSLAPGNCVNFATPNFGTCRALQGLPCNLPPISNDQLACLGTEALMASLNITPTTPIFQYGFMNAPPQILLMGTGPGFVDTQLRLQQFFVGVAVDRDEDGSVPDNIFTLQPCNGAPGTLTDCSLCGFCSQIFVDLRITVENVADGIVLSFDATNVTVLQQPVGCGGGANLCPIPVPVNDVQDAIEELIDATPPIPFNGLTIFDLFTLEMIAPTALDTGGTPDEDYAGAALNITPTE